MPQKKIIIINCPSTVRLWLSEALQLYTDAAYPPGASECAMVARESLLTVAHDLQGDRDTVEVSKRIRAMFKSAINFYFDKLDSQQDQPLTTQRTLALDALRGKKITASDLPTN